MVSSLLHVVVMAAHPQGGNMLSIFSQLLGQSSSQQGSSTIGKLPMMQATRHQPYKT